MGNYTHEYKKDLTNVGYIAEGKIKLHYVEPN